MNKSKSNSSIYLTGALVGAILGVIASILLEKSAKIQGGDIHLTGKKISRFGLAAISALWTIIDQGKVS